MLPCRGQSRRPRQRPHRDRRGTGGHLRHRHGLGRAVSRQSGQGHAHRNFQYQPLRRGPRRPALPCGADERGVRQRPAEGDGGAAGRRALPADGRFAGRCAAHHPQPLRQLCAGPGGAGCLRPVLRCPGGGAGRCSPVQRPV